MRFLYDCLFGIYVLIYLPFLILRGKWHEGFKERLGFLSPEIIKDLSRTDNIWLHAVSVGEVMMLEGILTGLSTQYPSHRIVITVTTKTGYSVAQRKYKSWATVLWSPLDFSLVVDLFVRAIHPVFYVVAETELWPNLFLRLKQDKVRIFVVNGRISDAAFPKYMWVRKFLRSTLARVDCFAMQSSLDAERIIQMGALSSQVQVPGNVKFDSVPDTASADRRQFGLTECDQVFLGASTHPGEEDALLDIYAALSAARPALRLVLAPRHPERSSAIALAVRSHGLEPILLSGQAAHHLERNQVLIVDGIGHLLSFYSLATVVFVGKSLTVKGGHNIIEPALYGKPVIIGPHMQNFKDIALVFIRDKAVIQVTDVVSLKAEVEALLDNPQACQALGARAQEVILKNRGATLRIMNILSKCNV